MDANVVEALTKEAIQTSKGRGYMTPLHEGQTYRFGWFVAVSSLANVINPQLFNGLSDAFGIWGTVFAAMVAGWFLAIGKSPCPT